MGEEAVEVGEGGSNVRVVGRRRGIGEIGQGEEEGQRRRRRRGDGGSRCSRNAVVHGWQRVENSGASVPVWCGGVIVVVVDEVGWKKEERGSAVARQCLN